MTDIWKGRRTCTSAWRLRKAFGSNQQISKIWNHKMVNIEQWVRQRLILSGLPSIIYCRIYDTVLTRKTPEGAKINVIVTNKIRYADDTAETNDYTYTKKALECGYKYMSQKQKSFPSAVTCKRTILSIFIIALISPTYKWWNIYSPSYWHRIDYQ